MWGVKSRKYQTKNKKNSTISCSKGVRKGVMAAEEWKNENNRDLSFFGDEGITNSPCSPDALDPSPPLPVPLSAVMTWGPAGSFGEVCAKGERSSAPGFSCYPLSPWQSVLTGEKKLIYVRVTEHEWLSGVRTDAGSTSERKQETKHYRLRYKHLFKITAQTPLGWKENIPSALG